MDLMRFYSMKGNCSRTAVITVCALLWVKVAERMGEAMKEDDEKEKEREKSDNIKIKSFYMAKRYVVSQTTNQSMFYNSY